MTGSDSSQGAAELARALSDARSEIAELRRNVEALLADRQRLDAALGAANRQLSGLLESAGDVIAMLDTSYRYTLFNSAFHAEFKRIFGVSLTPGDSMLEALAGLPGDLANARTYWDRALAGEDFTVTQEFGDARLGRDWYELHFSPTRDSGGKVTGAVHVVRNITDRRKVEEALDRQNGILTALLETLPLGVFMVEAPHGTPLFANSTALSLLGRGIVAEADKETLAEVYQAYQRPGEIVYPHEQLPIVLGLSGTRSHVDDMVVVRPDGQETMLEVFGAPVIDREGKTWASLVTFLDITARKKEEERLRTVLAALQRSNGELERFSYVASHDLNEPLRMVSSFLQLLAERYRDQLDDRARKYIDYAVDGALRMQALIRDLLAYSQAGSRAAELQPVDANVVLAEARRNLGAAIDESGAVITSDELPTVSYSPSQLLLVLQNLLANGIKFRGRDRPQVHVSAREVGPEWSFSVQDNGIGIEPQHRERIFVLFQRLHSREEYPGTGMGLAICKRIVEEHGGRIWFESQPGSGTTFLFTLPKPRAPAPRRPA